MKIVPLPQAEEARRRKAAFLQRLAKAYNACLLAAAILAVACLVGVLIVVILLEMSASAEENATLYYILTGCFAAGAVVFALLALLFGKLAQEGTRTHLDFVERMNGEAYFFVGEGTLAEFTADALLIRGAEGGRKPIKVPYRDIRFHSVCTRTQPQERGRWSVVMEMPAHYVMKKGDAPRALIETDGKERLYAAIEERGLALLGEQPPRGETRANVRFTPRTKFLLPDAQRRKRSLMMALVGAVLVVAGALIVALWADFLLVGCILGVFGLFFAVRSLFAFARAKGMFAVYEEGIYWKESGRAEADKFFLKWSELVRISQETVEGKHYLAAECAYGKYHIPEVAGVYDYLRAARPDLCGEDDA